jgi:hypothetical protein
MNQMQDNTSPVYQSPEKEALANKELMDYLRDWVAVPLGGELLAGTANLGLKGLSLLRNFLYPVDAYGNKVLSLGTNTVGNLFKAGETMNDMSSVAGANTQAKNIIADTLKAKEMKNVSDKINLMNTLKTTNDVGRAYGQKFQNFLDLQNYMPELNPQDWLNLKAVRFKE